MSSMSMSLPGANERSRKPHTSGGERSVTRPQAAPSEGYSSERGPSLRDFLSGTFRPICTVPEKDRVGISDSAYRILHERCCLWCRQKGVAEPIAFADPEEGLCFLNSYIGNLSDYRTDVLFLEDDGSWHITETGYVGSSNKVYLVSLRPTFEDMSPEAGRLVRGFLKSMFHSNDGYYGLDLLEYMKGYLECDVEDNWRCLDDEELEAERRKFDLYFVNGRIYECLAEYSCSDAVTQASILAFIPKDDREKALKDLLLEGSCYIGSLYQFLCCNSDLQGICSDEYDDDFIPVEFLYGVTWDSNDGISDACIERLNEWSGNGAEQSCLVANSEIGFGEPLALESSESYKFHDYYSRLIDFIDEYKEHDTRHQEADDA